MMTAQFVSGASIFALLIVDICCLPLQKGSNPGAYGSSYSNILAGQSSHGAVLPNNAPSKGTSTLSRQAAAQLGSSFPQPTANRGPVPSVGYSSSSGTASSGYRDSSVWNNPANAAQPGAAFQPGSQDVNWAVAPLNRVSGGDGMSVPSGVFSQTGYVGQALPPPGPMYQGGDLSRFERDFEHGNTERETEEQGWLPPPFMVSAGPAFTSQPQPGFNFGWGRLPYPYDVTFLTGRYPPGTYSHASSSYEQGADRWQDTHYVVDSVPYNSGSVPQKGTSTDFAVPQSNKGPTTLVGAAHYGQAGLPAAYQGSAQAGLPTAFQGGAQAGLPAAHHGGFRQLVGNQASGNIFAQF